jgi:hypothetical protein
MLDGQGHSSDSSGEDSGDECQRLFSQELLVTLKAIEKEISQFICSAADHVPTVPEGHDPSAV